MISLLLTAAVGYSVESTTGAVVGRHNPIYTHSVSSRRSANRTCGFPASGSLQDHAFAHGGSRAGADGRTRRNNMLGARRAGGESPCRPSRASGTTTGGADHGPERRQIRRHRQFADTSSTSSFAFTCGALRSSSTFRRGQTQSVNRLSLAPASTVPGPRVLPSTGITRLHRYYDPIRHPKGPVPCLTTPPLASTACQPPQGASRVAHNPSFTHAVAITPAEPLGALIVRFPNGGGLPRNSGGSASALPFSRPAQRSLHVTAYALAKSLTDPLHQKLRPVRYLHGRSDCYRLERHLPGGIRTH